MELSSSLSMVIRDHELRVRQFLILNFEFLIANPNDGEKVEVKIKVEGKAIFNSKF